ncbi:MAG: hypothetical protein AVO35_12900 [Candidatus Aegiribacteria sp. MLS_C]|nr:MAG: hypothetical protein AVO35_12900 [Candidatus Aegiribacteria sp. MLS_C]
MTRLAIPLLFLAALQTEAQEAAQGTASRGGLSGFLFLPESEVLPVGHLMVQGRLEYLDSEAASNPFLLLPLTVTWGAVENLEIGGEIPFYLNDPLERENVAGDLTLGCGWLYETARGGSAIVLRGSLRLPTGETGRDRGTELEVGAATGTTFRLFRLQAAASYVLNGGDDPFENDIEDYSRFSIGGASYVAEDIQVVLAMEGTTTGELGMSGSGVLYAFGNMAVFGTLRVGLSGTEDATLAGGLSWTGSGF